MSQLDADPSVDILCPRGKFLLRDPGEPANDAEDAERSVDRTPTIETPSADIDSITEDNSDEPDLEDLFGAASPPKSDASNHQSLVAINDAGDWRFKPSVLSILQSETLKAKSDDRIKRVRTITKFDEPDRRLLSLNSDSLLDPNRIMVDDPVTILICDELPFLAVVAVTGFKVGNQSRGSVLVSELKEVDVCVSFQVLHLQNLAEADTGQDDWAWDPASRSLYKKESSGIFIEPYNPSLIETHTDSDRDTGGGTVKRAGMSFKTDELRASAALLYDRCKERLNEAEIVSRTSEFPYREAKGKSEIQGSLNW